MKSKVALYQTLYSRGCSECYPGITSATPVAWLDEDTYAVILRQEGGYCLTEMSAQEIAAYENCEASEIEEEIAHELALLAESISAANPKVLANLLLNAPDVLIRLLPMLDVAKHNSEISLDHHVPLR